MIGRLPTALKVDGKEYAIRTDFRDILVIMQAFNDPDLSDTEKALVMIGCLYEEAPDNIEQALEQASWFIDGGPYITEKQQSSKKLIDWEQDEQMMFSAVNKVAGYETRAKEYIHWWTFLGYFNEIGEGLYSTVLNIRRKKSKGKKLDKAEDEFYKRNKAIITIKERLSAKEREQLNAVNELLGI